MSFATQTVAIPVWFLILMIAAMLPVLIKLANIAYRFKRQAGEMPADTEQEQRDALWRLTNRIRTASPKQRPEHRVDEKKQAQKMELVKILKILLTEDEKGVLMQTVADRMGANIVNIQHAMARLVEKNMVDEVVSTSGAKYYLTRYGKDYCRRKMKQKSGAAA